MITIRSFSNPQSLRFYLEREAEGRWVGEGAEMLGLPQQVSKEEWRAIRFGLDPETGEKLRIRAVVDRTYRDKEGDKKIYRARQMYDITISAPKTISVQHLVDPKMREAHQAAADSTRRQMERLCGSMVVAEYHHEHSRKLDPQLHTHLVAANLAYDHDRERWRTLHVNEVFQSREELTQHYRDRLSDMLEGWGYKVDRAELPHISQELCDRFSQRSGDREELKQDFRIREGREPSNSEVAIMMRENRDKKQISQNIHHDQIDRLTPSEHEQLIRVKQEASLRMSISESITPEPGHHIEKWEYGERQSYKRGRGMRI